MLLTCTPNPYKMYKCDLNVTQLLAIAVHPQGLYLWVCICCIYFLMCVYVFAST